MFDHNGHHPADDAGTLHDERELLRGEFADVWDALRRSGEPAPSAGFSARLRETLHAELARRTTVVSVVRDAAPAARPGRALVFRMRFAAAAAGLLAAAGLWLASGDPDASVEPAPGGDPVASVVSPVTVPDAVPDAVPSHTVTPGPVNPAHDLSAVSSVPEDLLAEAEALAEIRRQSETLDTEIRDMGRGGAVLVSAEALSEHFPFLERTFEQTLDGL
jgi:hypothetical protein